MLRYTSMCRYYLHVPGRLTLDYCNCTHSIDKRWTVEMEWPKWTQINRKFNRPTQSFGHRRAGPWRERYYVMNYWNTAQASVTGRRTRGWKSWRRSGYDRQYNRIATGPRGTSLGWRGWKTSGAPDHSPRWSYFNSGDPVHRLRGAPPIVWIRHVRHTQHSIATVASTDPRENASGDHWTGGGTRAAGRWTRPAGSGRSWDTGHGDGARRKRWRRNKRTRSRPTTVVASRRKTFDSRYHRLSVELVLSATRDRSTDKWRTVNSTVYRPTHGPWKKKKTPHRDIVVKY